MAKKANRQAELARIHIGKKDLGMNDDEYRTMLHTITGKSSAGDLTARQRYQVLDHMKSLQEGPKKSYPGRPHNMDGNSTRARHLCKIEALLTVGKRPWSYAHAMAKRMYRVDDITFLSDPEDLRGIISALIKQGRKEGWDLE